MLRTSEASSLASLGDFDAAEERLTDVMTSFEELVSVAPEEARHQHWLASHRVALAAFFIDRGRHDEADELLATSRAVLTNLDAAVPGQHRYRVTLATIGLLQGRADLGAHRFSEAVETLRPVCDQLEAMLSEHPGTFDLLDLLTSARAALGRALLAEADTLAPPASLTTRSNGFEALESARDVARSLVEEGRGGAPLREALTALEAELEAR